MSFNTWIRQTDLNRTLIARPGHDLHNNDLKILARLMANIDPRFIAIVKSDFGTILMDG
jgi:methylmalonyl-CoA mutase cobalamin-binding subunit